MDNKPYITWEEMQKKLNLTDEQKEEIQLETDIIQATIEARKSNKLTQRELSKKSGVRQPIIARLEKRVNSPDTTTLIKILHPMGYTLRVVPLDKNKIKT